MNKKSKIITSVLVFATIICVGGYSKAHSDIDPMEIINRINTNSKQETPANTTETPKALPVSTTTKAPETTVNNAPQNTCEINKDYKLVSPLDLVSNPSAYMGKKVKFQAKFDKFSTLGLDYQPAMRSSENYITILIQRPDVSDHDVPLGELKIFMDRKAAEKHIDLNSGDEVEIAGTIFSKALGDAWLNVDNFTVVKTFPKQNNN